MTSGGGGGDLVTVMSNIVTIGNGDGADGALKIREKKAGNLDVTLTNILSVNNFGSGIFARESQAGNSVVTIQRALVSGNKISRPRRRRVWRRSRHRVARVGWRRSDGNRAEFELCSERGLRCVRRRDGRRHWSGDIERRDLHWRPNGAGDTGGNAIVP